MTIETGNLDKLLGWDGDLTTYQEVELERNGFNINIKLQSMDSKLNKKIEKDCTEISKNKGEITRVVNERMYLLKQIFHCIVDPNLQDEKLQAKFNANGFDYLIVEKIFKVGEQIRLAKIIQRISGFSSSVDDMDNEIENLLNRSRRDIRSRLDYFYLARAVLQMRKMPSEINSMPLGEKVFLYAALNIKEEANEEALKGVK